MEPFQFLNIAFCLAVVLGAIIPTRFQNLELVMERCMRIDGFVIMVCLGMSLAAMGCGGAVGPGQTELLDPVEQKENCLDCQGDGVTTVKEAMSLETFMSYSQSPTSAGCLAEYTFDQFAAELEYGLNQGLITTAAYEWGLANGFYPVIDRYDRIGAVCWCECFEVTR